MALSGEARAPGSGGPTPVLRAGQAHSLHLQVLPVRFYNIVLEGRCFPHFRDEET